MVLVSHFSWPILVKLDLILTNHPWKSTECSKTVYLYLERRTFLWALSNGAIIATTISSGWQSGWKMCEVDLNSSWYLECNGLRQRSSPHFGIMQKLFTFTNMSLFNQKSQFAVKVRTERTRSITLTALSLSITSELWTSQPGFFTALNR